MAKRHVPRYRVEGVELSATPRYPTPDEMHPAFDKVVDFFHSRDKATAWWLTRNALLGGISPAVMVAMGRGKKLSEFIDHQISENAPYDPAA